MTEEQQQSGLPSLEQVREEQTMRIYTINTKQFPSKRVETTLRLTNPVGTPNDRPMIGVLINIDDKRIKEFMPSKVWASEQTQRHEVVFDVLFYVNTTLPKAVRPFKDNTYLLYFFPGYGDVIEYNAEMRIFMDQVHVPKFGTAYVIMFGEETYNDIIIKEV